MSLDVYLTTPQKRKVKSSGIYIRENGSTVEISESEYRKRFPDREPIRLEAIETETNVAYNANITHNLTGMAEAAGIYNALWRPYKLLKEYDIPEGDREAEYEFEETNVVRANQIVDTVYQGLKKLKADPDTYRQFNSPNGWGTYDTFVFFVEKYLEALMKYPDAIVTVSR